MKGIFVLCTLLSCAHCFTYVSKASEDPTPLASNTFVIDLANLNSYKVEHTVLYGTPVTVFKPSPSDPVLSVFYGGKLIWKSPGDECVGITSTYATEPRLISLDIKTIDLVREKRFYMETENDWLKVDEETFVSLIQQTGMNANVMIDIRNINRAACNVSVAPVGHVEVTSVSPKDEFRVTEVLDAGTLIWSGSKAIQFSFAPLTMPLFISIISEDIEGNAAMEYFAKVGNFWATVNEFEYTAGLNGLDKRLVAVDGVLNIQDVLKNLRIGALGHISLTYKSPERLTKVMDGSAILWTNEEECTDVLLHCRMNGEMLLQVNVLTREGRGSRFFQNGTSWIPITEETFRDALKAMLTTYASLDVCGPVPPEDLVETINVHPFGYPSTIYNSQPDVHITSVFCGDKHIWSSYGDEYCVSASIVDEHALEMLTKSSNGIVRTLFTRDNDTWEQVAEPDFIAKLALVKRTGFMAKYIPTVSGFISLSMVPFLALAMVTLSL